MSFRENITVDFSQEFERGHIMFNQPMLGMCAAFNCNRSDLEWLRNEIDQALVEKKQ
jgi:hypothetical protein